MSVESTIEQRPREAPRTSEALAFATLDRLLSVAVARADFLASGLLTALVSVVLLRWYVRAETTVLPRMDGTAHLTGVANLVTSFKLNGPGQLLTVDFAPAFLAYRFLAIPSALLGNGRIAFAVGWVICLALLVLAIWWMLGRERTPLVRSFALALLLAAGLFQSIHGGALDTRVDLVSITLAFLMLAAMVRGALFFTALLLLAASYAKGSALPLLLPIVLVGFAVGYLRPRRPRLSPIFVLQVGLLGALVGFFVVNLGRDVIAYNLMATGASSSEDRVGAYLANWRAYLLPEPLFYYRQLSVVPSRWIVAAAVVALAVGVWRRWPWDLVRLGAFALFTFGYTYVLLSVSPVRHAVLTVWFLPAMGLIVVFLTRAFARSAPGWVVGIAALGLAYTTVMELPRAPTLPPEEYRPAVASIFTQTDQTAAWIDEQLAGRTEGIALVTNFLSDDWPIQYAAYTYQALLQERVRRTSLVIFGWELGVTNPDWRRELKAVAPYSFLLIVAQERPINTGLGGPQQEAAERQFWDHITNLRRERRFCLEQIVPPIELPNVGQQVVYMLRQDEWCRARFFQD